MTPLDLQRLAVRIEGLLHQHTHGWDGADEMDFSARLRNPRNPRALPSPESLREMADGKREMPTEMQLRSWYVWTRDLEDMVRDNRPGSQKRLIRDWSRGRVPTY